MSTLGWSFEDVCQTQAPIYGKWSRGRAIEQPENCVGRLSTGLSLVIPSYKWGRGVHFIGPLREALTLLEGHTPWRGKNGVLRATVS